MAVNSSGSVYVAGVGNNRIQKFAGDGKFITSWGSFGTGAGQFFFGRVAVDLKSGYVYVADMGGDSVEKFTGDGEFIKSWGSTGSGDGQFRGPTGLTVDLSGNVYAADVGNDRIQKFTGDGQFVTKWTNLGLGKGGNIHDTVGIDIDAAGKLYMANRDKNEVEVISTAGAK
jgi:tripartite motif-containing protein 71